MRLFVVGPLVCALLLAFALWGLLSGVPKAAGEHGAGVAPLVERPPPASPAAGRLERALLAEINAVRQVHGVAALQASTRLAGQARRDSWARASRRTGRVEMPPAPFASRLRLAPRLRGRLEWGVPAATVFPEAWLDGAESRAILLDPRWSAAGVGVWPGRGYLLITVLPTGY
ncbi:CAP domain-containing protein [Alkalilimnicola sp. S0819]|uniref:CAP domain-containing protein n=1 Tax=Alkalilimnicola sp. S0819 TaxID=2613922 RepID=UPI0012624A13|nr:hypothetical protein [Alkalilimnicola sp. S0819]KAB7628391.1 hypothetical protein F3N43_01460 [Alkalilimnicola sp. S0819]MPQ15294.1 hypothetical protein [Alkalilimnicola sp. S0819]